MRYLDQLRGDYAEFYNVLADWVMMGDPLPRKLVGRLRELQDAYIHNCNQGYNHQDAVIGVRRLARAVYGANEHGEPFWSNNHRRRAGLGPMPVRAIQRLRSATLDAVLWETYNNRQRVD